MQIEEALKMEEKAYKRRMAVRKCKCHDYAKEGADCLSNFKVMADLQFVLLEHGYGVPLDKSFGVAVWHLLHKLVRLLNLWNEGVVPENESLVDTHDDLSNYNDLAKECYIDEMREVFEE